MNVENTSTQGVTDIKVEIKVEHESDDEVESESDLYADHVIKQEMVIGPVVLQEVDVTYCPKPKDVPVHMTPKLETTDEETDQVKPQKGMKEDNTEVNFIKTSTTSRNTKRTNRRCNKTHGQSKIHRSTLSRRSHSDTGDKQYSCSYCEYKFNRMAHLSSHLRTHTGEKPYSCSHCEYKSSLKSSLTIHLRVHTGEKPYSCSHCDYKCKDSSSLSRHVRTHIGEKPYSCPYCDFKCKNNIHLLRHLRIRHR